MLVIIAYILLTKLLSLLMRGACPRCDRQRERLNSRLTFWVSLLRQTSAFLHLGLLAWSSWEEGSLSDRMSMGAILRTVATVIIMNALLLFIESRCRIAMVYCPSTNSPYP